MSVFPTESSAAALRVLVQLARILGQERGDEPWKEALELYRAKGNLAAVTRYELDGAPWEVRD